jgi:hypothetical protein
MDLPRPTLFLKRGEDRLLVRGGFLESLDEVTGAAKFSAFAVPDWTAVLRRRCDGL